MLLVQLRVSIGVNPQVACSVLPRRRISEIWPWHSYSSCPSWQWLFPFTWIWGQGLSVEVTVSSAQRSEITLLDAAQWRPKQWSPLSDFRVFLWDRSRGRGRMVNGAGHELAKCPGQAVYKMCTSVARLNQQQWCNFPHWNKESALLRFRPMP